MLRPSLFIALLRWDCNCLIVATWDTDVLDYVQSQWTIVLFCCSRSKESVKHRHPASRHVNAEKKFPNQNFWIGHVRGYPRMLSATDQRWAPSCLMWTLPRESPKKPDGNEQQRITWAQICRCRKILFPLCFPYQRIWNHHGSSSGKASQAQE